MYTFGFALSEGPFLDHFERGPSLEIVHKPIRSFCHASARTSLVSRVLWSRPGYLNIALSFCKMSQIC